jgi:dolichol-phosphate mannosyltransferase
VITVVLPAYNEAEAMPRLLARIREALPAIDEPVRVIVVDDGSEDGTADEAHRARDQGLDVEVIRHPNNRGLHAAVATGLRAAVEPSGPDDWIVMMDADDTHPPHLIGPMLQKGRAGCDVVTASRFQPGAEWHGRTWDRILFSHGVRWLFMIFWPLRGVRDYTCGYRLYRVSLLREACARWGEGLISEPSFACMPDLLWKLSRLTTRLCEVPLPLHYDRKPGPSKMNVTRTVWRTLVLLVRRRVGL